MADVHPDMPQVMRIPKVPENLLKRRKKYQGLKENYKRSNQNLQRRRNGEKFHFKRPESFVRDSRQRHRDKVRLSRLARKPASLLPVPTSPRLAFALRIRSYPNLKSVRELILKRGRTMVKGRSTPLSDNSLVEEKLGKCGIICLEDVIHEVFSLGPHFKVSSLFLHPFMLPVARHSRRNRTRQALETGHCGDRASAINELIRKLN